MGRAAASTSSIDARSAPAIDGRRAPAPAGACAGSGTEDACDAPAAGVPARVALGRVVGAHGLRGRLRVRCFGDDPVDLTDVCELLIGRSLADPEARAYAVVRTEPGRAGELRIELEGLRSRDAAEELRGRLVMVPPAALGSLPEGEYWGFELIGCRVEDEEGELLGRVRDIWETGAADVLILDAPGGGEHLIPAAREFLREVDVADRRIVVRVIPGLLAPQDEPPADDGPTS